MATVTDRRVHRHVSVFHGPRQRYNPGLVLIPYSGGDWEILDETGQIGQADAVYGTFASERAAFQEALRLLRVQFGEGTVPVWEAGGRNQVLVELGYTRGRLRWRWWPPGLYREGESSVGTDGAAAKPNAPAA